MFSANHGESLRNTIIKYEEYVTSSSDSLSDIAYTLARKREHLGHRAFCVTKGQGKLEVMSASKPRVLPQIQYVFTGQGSTWAGMAVELLSYTSFRSDIDLMDSLLKDLPHPPQWTIKGIASNNVVHLGC